MGKETADGNRSKTPTLKSEQAPLIALRALLELGRVSNLPTVWSNVLAGAALASSRVDVAGYAYASAALSLAYVGGMFLNDAFDRNVDARLRPERPIPSGRIRAETVFRVGFGLLAASVGLVAWTATRVTEVADSTPAVVSIALLCATIVVYDFWHKTNALAPWLMGLCRALVYTTSYFVFEPHPRFGLWLAALLLMTYVVALTYAAKRENRKREERARSEHPKGAGPEVLARLVARAIAGIALVDAAVIAASGTPSLAAVALALFGLTLLFQRSVPGT